MKGKIFKIKNMDDELVLPITTTEAVYSEDGKTLNDELDTIENEKATRQEVDVERKRIDNINSSLEHNTKEIKDIIEKDYAKKTDLNSKAEVSVVNDINSKISNLTDNSPSGVYANLNALKTAKPNGESKVYITSDNGNWNYWNGSEWVSGGSFQSSVREEKHNLNCNIIPSVNGYPNYDSSTGIFDFNSSSGADVVLLYDNTYYVIPPETTITNTQGSTAVKLTFDRNSKAFNFRAYNYVMSDNELLVFTFRRVNGGRYFIPCGTFPIRLNGTFDYLLEGVTLTKNMFSKEVITSDLRTPIGSSFNILIPYSCKLPNLDTHEKTLTFFKDTVLFYNNEHLVLNTDEVINLTMNSSSAKKIWFKTDTKTFHLGAYNTVINEKCIIFATCRYISEDKYQLNMPSDYTINGSQRFQPYGKYNVTYKAPLNATIKSIAHRGYSADAPENTLPSFKLAKEKGFSYVEVDISWTSDNVPVCLHDETIDRTSNGVGKITDLSLEQVKMLDFGSWKDVKYTGTTIPTLKEFLIYCKKLNLHPYIEVKGTLTEQQAKIITDLVRYNSMKGKCSYIGFKIENLLLLKLMNFLPMH